MGYPAAGKTSMVTPFEEQGYERLNRDTLGGRLKDLLPRLSSRLAEGHRRFVLDNTYPARKSRAEVLEVADLHDVPVRCVWVQTSEEEAQVNATLRMLGRYENLLGPDEIKVRGKDDPNLFGPGAQLRYRRAFEEPSVEEGFAVVEPSAFVRRWGPEYTNRALILDYDGTLRETKSGDIYPVDPDDVRVMPNRTEVLQRYLDEGFLLLGASNQSGVARGRFSLEAARACLERTNELLGLEIDALFCPHPSGPPVCWCRKPLPGMGVHHILKYKLDPAQCIMVGDRSGDVQMARRCGFQYVDAADFFAV
jgi:histidinol-phosphate phosphatase family protein